MAKRGPKPKPETLKILAGSRDSRLGGTAPAASQSLPDCPEHLADDPAAREAWARMTARLGRMGVLAETDSEALVLYCSTFSRWLKALAEIRAAGLTVSTGTGGEKTNPAVGIAERAEAQLRALLVEFGCTPSSRGRVKGGGDPKRDRLADFQARRPAR